MSRNSKLLKSSKPLQKKRKRLLNISIFYSIIIISLILLFILILRLSIFKINTVNSNTNYSKEIENIVLNTINDNYLYIIPKSNIFLYSKFEIISKLKDEFKEIDSIQINRTNLNTLNLNIIERNAKAIVCEGFNNDMDNSDNCYFIDNNSTVFKKINEKIELFHYYLNTDKGDNLLGTSLFPKDKFIAIQSFINTIIDLGLKVNGLLILENGEFELYLENSDGSDMIVYFNDKASIINTSSIFIAFWNDSRILKKGEKKLPIFESVNLRFGNNIFYVTK